MSRRGVEEEMSSHNSTLPDASGTSQSNVENTRTSSVSSVRTRACSDGSESFARSDSSVSNRSRADSSLSSASSSQGSRDSMIGAASADVACLAEVKVLIMGEDDTRSKWCGEKDLPTALIAEYNKQCKMERELISINYSGHSEVTATIVASDVAASEEPPPKKSHTAFNPATEGPLKKSEGDASKLTCRTEKDRHVKLNDQTAGVLAGMWPCGVVLFVNELFISESISQVYGILHEFLAKQSSLTPNLKYICYDDGCHLTKFCQNPIRKDLTETTKLMSSIKIVVDKMHVRGHVDAWYLENCDSRKMKDFDKEESDHDADSCDDEFPTQTLPRSSGLVRSKQPPGKARVAKDSDPGIVMHDLPKSEQSNSNATSKSSTARISENTASLVKVELGNILNRPPYLFEVNTSAEEAVENGAYSEQASSCQSQVTMEDDAQFICDKTYCHKEKMTLKHMKALLSEKSTKHHRFTASEYNLCLEVQFITDDVAIGIAIRKGPDDDELTWPFDMIVLFRLKNLSGGKSLVRMFRCDGNTSEIEEATTQPTSTMNTAVGFPCYIPRQRLLDEGFIKDNQMLLECYLFPRDAKIKQDEEVPSLLK